MPALRIDISTEAAQRATQMLTMELSRLGIAANSNAVSMTRMQQAVSSSLQITSNAANITGRAITSTFQSLTGGMGGLSGIFNQVVGHAQNLGRVMITEGNRSRGVFGTLGTTMGWVGNQAQSLGSTIFRAGQEGIRSFLSLQTLLTAIAGTAFIGMIGKNFLDVAVQFEKFSTQLITITGNSIRAEQAMSWIKDFAKTTPYDVGQVTESFVRLSAYGLDAKKWMGVLGDTASAMGKNLIDGVEMLADAATGQFERLKEFGVKAKTEGDNVTFSWSQNGQDMVITSQKTQSGITEALGQIFSRFNGGMKAMSQTWEGMMSNLSDNWTNFRNEVMTSGPFQAMKEGLSEFLTYLDSNEGKMNMAQWAQNMAKGVLQAFKVIAQGAKSLTEAIAGIRIAFGYVMKGISSSSIKENEAILKSYQSQLQPSLKTNLFGFDDETVQKAKEGITKYTRIIADEKINLTAANMMIEGNSKAIIENEKAFDGLIGTLTTWQNTTKSKQYVDSWAVVEKPGEDAAARLTKAELAAQKKAASAAESEAKRAAKEAIRDAETLAKEKEQINDDYLKTMSVSYDYERTKAKEAFEYRKSRNQDIAENTRQLNFELRDIDDKQTEDFSKNFEELTRASKDEAEQRAKDAADALEQQRQDYEDFVSDVTAATSDAFMELFDGGFSSFFDEIESMFKRTIANLAAEAIAKPIIIPVIQSVAGTVGTDIATAMGLPSAAIPAGTQSGFNLSSASNIFSALSGGIEAGAYKALTSGMLGSVGEGLFGSAAWLGKSTVLPTAVPGVMTPSGAAAIAGQQGLGGIASTLAAAAPWIAAAVAAYTIIAPMLEDKPEPFLRVQTGTKADMESRGYKFDIGEGQSNAGYGYNLTMQDIDDPARKEFGTAITKMLDAQMKGIEDALNVSVNDAITIAQARAGQYGAGFFSKVDLRDYEGDIEGALKALSDDLFTDIQSDLVNQLKDSSGTALSGQGGIFDADFFSGISVDGESAVDTFLRFGSVIQDTDDFMSEFTRQMSEFGASSIQAYNNVATLSAIDTAFQTAIDGFNSNTLIDNLKAIDDSYDKTIAKMNQLNATAESLAKAEAARQVDKWKSMTGIDANSITTAIWNDLNTTGSSADFVGNIASQVRDALKQAVMTSMIASTITPLITTMIGTSFDGVDWNDATSVKTASDAFDKLINSSTELKTRLDALGKVATSLSTTSTTTGTGTTTTDNRPFAANSAFTTAWNSSGGGSYNQYTWTGYAEAIKEAAEKAKELAANLKELADYLASNSSKTDLFKSSVASLQSAIDNYVKYSAAIEKSIFNGEDQKFTISDVFAATINEALTPALEALSSAFDSVGAFAYTDTERAVASISNSFADLRGSLTYLQQSLAPLGETDLNLSGFFTQANQMLDLLEKAELMQIAKADLQTIGEAKAQIWGLEDTFKLQQFGTKYDVEQLQYAGRSMDSKTLDNIRYAVEAYTASSYSQLLAFADSYGVSVEEFTSDILSLNEILKETSDEFKTLRDSLKDYADKLLLSDVADTYLSPIQKTQMSAKELAKIYIDAMSSDTVKQQTAMGKLPTAADDYLKFSKASTTDMYAYNRDVATVLSRVRQIQEEASGKVVEDIASLQLTEAEGQTDIQNAQLLELRNISADIGAIDKWNSENIRDNTAIDKFFTDFPTLLSNFEFKTLQTSNEYLITALQGMDWKSIFSAQNTFPTGLDLKLPDGFLTALTNYPVEFNRGVDALIKELQNSFGSGTATTTEAGKSVQGLLGKYKDDAIGINLSNHQGNTLLTKSTLDDLIAYKGTVSNLTSRGLFNGTNAESSSTIYLSDMQFLIDELSKPFSIFEKYAGAFGFDVSTIQISSEAIKGLQTINSDSDTLLNLASQSGETSETFIRDMFALSKYMDGALTTSSDDLNKGVVLSGGTFGSTVTGAGKTFKDKAIEAGDSFKLDSILAGVTLTGSATTSALSLTTSATAAGKTLTDQATTSMTTWTSGVQLSADKMILMSNGVSNAIGVSGNSFSTLAVTAGNSLSSVLSTAGGAFGMQIAAAAGVGAGAITDAQTKAAKLVSDAQAAASKKILEIQTSATASIAAAQQAASVPQTQTGINPAVTSLPQNTFEDSMFLQTLLTFPKYASGGYHAGGLRLVGEAGPELEYTPPSRIFSNSDTKNIFDISELVAENKKLNAEMKEIKRYLWQMTVNTKIAADNLDNFNENGMTVSVAA